MQNIQDIIAMIMGRLPQAPQAGNPLQGLLQRLMGGQGQGQGQGMGMMGQRPGWMQRPAWGQRPQGMIPPTMPSTPATPPTGGVSASAPQGHAWGHNFKQQFGMAPGKDQTAFKAFKQGPTV